MSVPVAATGEEAVTRTVGPDDVNTGLSHEANASAYSFEELYEIEKAVDFVHSGPYKRVALQFPDGLLVDSTRVAMALQSGTGSKFFVLADTSYGSCCVDEVAAAHIDADAVIHYGSSCLSRTSRLPVMYVYGRRPIDAQAFAAALKGEFPAPDHPVAVFFDPSFYHASGALSAAVAAAGLTNVVFTRILGDAAAAAAAGEKEAQTQPGAPAGAGQPWPLSAGAEAGTAATELWFGNCSVVLPPGAALPDFTVVFVGRREDPSFVNLMMTENKCKFYSFDPAASTLEVEGAAINKALMRRFYMVQKAKDAAVIGIVAGTLGVANYMDVINTLKSKIKNAGRKSYLFVVGKVNPAKLANFPEVDVFVMVACPHSAIVDSKEYYKPIVTPFELEMALSHSKEWNGDYVTDFKKLLPCIDLNDVGTDGGADDDTEGAKHFSFVTGRIVDPRLSARVPEDSTAGALVARADESGMQVSTLSAAGMYLQTRNFKGLEQKIGETDAMVAVEGQVGIARGYSGEPGKE